MVIIAHRSGPVNYPEQTVQSAREALSLGADVIEIDVRLTFDGVLAVCHDPNAKRVFGVDKEIAQMTSAEFRTLRHVKDPAFCSHLFEDILKTGVAPLLIHIKSVAGTAPEAIISELVRLVEKYDYTDRVIFGIPSTKYISVIREMNDKIRILSFGDRDKTDDFISAGIDYIRHWEEWLEPEVVEKVKSSNSKLWVMSGIKGAVGYPTEEGLRKILSFEPDGILINDVRILK